MVGEVVTLPERRIVAPSQSLIVPRVANEFDCYALEPRDYKEAWTIAGKIVEARMFGKFSSHEQVFSVILAGRVRGVGAIMALENAYIVGDQVAWKSQFIVGSVLASGASDYLEIVESDEKRAMCVTRRKASHGGTGQERRVEFTIEHARALGYLNPPKEGKKEGSWLTQPEVMIATRCEVKTARRYYKDIISGMYEPSELHPDGKPIEEEK